ncbi:MAG: FAD-dependent thymidylate synthase [Treponema sp.]|nr:FAD-dependent thymidylate synthase [Treponema sp.]
MITILPQTDKEPLNTIGYCAGVCWNSPVDDKEKNIKRAKSCILSGHTRTAEYPDVFCIVEGYSARCIRELYTHIIGTTRLQSSTRYVDAKNMDVSEDFYSPFTDEADQVYRQGLSEIMETYQKLEELGYPKEDAANILPLGMESKIVWKINLRALMHFMNMRLCTRAYKEIRQLSNELKAKLRVLSPEWEWICDNLLLPKCEAIGYCDEAKCCGRSITKEQMLQAVAEKFPSMRRK